MEQMLEKDIIWGINLKALIISIELLYILPSEALERLQILIDKAPFAYSIEYFENSKYPFGSVLELKLLED